MSYHSIFAAVVVAFVSCAGFEARAETVKDCSVMARSLSTLDAKAIAKCADIQAQHGPLFLGDGRSQDIAACWAASGQSVSTALNSCTTYAVTNGKNPRGCTEIANFKTADGYQCIYNSLYYLKDSSTAFIGFTLDSETQQKLFVEAQARSISVRELIAEKLQK
ncbi:hypothetical protein BH10BDE1_BH10BDE1_21850 [soil metagenome]